MSQFSRSRQASPTDAGRKFSFVASSLSAPLFFVALVGPNAAAGALSLFVLAVGVALLWRPGETPVLLAVFGAGWLGASISVFHSNWLWQPLENYTPFHSDMNGAVTLSLFGLLAMAAGMRLGAGRWTPKTSLMSQDLAMQKSAIVWFRLYVAGAILALVIRVTLGFAPGLDQLILGFVVFKWAAYFTLAYATFLRRGVGGAYLIFAFVLELAQSIGGFFADFRTVFLISLLSVVASGPRSSRQILLAAGLLSTMMILMGTIWTAVKMPYRNFVSGGTMQQVLVVPLDERIMKLADLVGNMDMAAMTGGFDAMLRRLSYVEFFGASLEVVPALVPHENGSIYSDAIIRPFMPRIFFPDKAVIDDTVRTNLFTGGIAGNSEGTSISLGYIAEAYIDFGRFGMMGALALVGFFYGFLYRMLTGPSLGSPLAGMAIASAMLVGVGSLDNSFTKTFGGVVVNFIAAIIVMRWIIPTWYPWLLMRFQRV